MEEGGTRTRPPGLALPDASRQIPNNNACSAAPARPRATWHRVTRTFKKPERPIFFTHPLVKLAGGQPVSPVDGQGWCQLAEDDRTGGRAVCVCLCLDTAVEAAPAWVPVCLSASSAGHEHSLPGRVKLLYVRGENGESRYVTTAAKANYSRPGGLGFWFVRRDFNGFGGPSSVPFLHPAPPLGGTELDGSRQSSLDCSNLRAAAAPAVV